MELFELLFWYGLLSLVHLFLQINLAHADYLVSKRLRPVKDFTPSVSIIVPSYNENSKDLTNCIKSALRQNYKGSIQVILVDDGSSNDSVFNAMTCTFSEEIQSGRLIAIRYETNKGKRHAQKTAFDMAIEEIIVTIDSDTILRQSAVRQLVKGFSNPEVGAITGSVRVRNKKHLLGKLVDKRYWTAFHQERAAQNLFGNVLCCSGPLAAYRNSIIQEVKEDYTSQKFLGQNCTYGDDRHLTNLVLSKGYKVKFQPKAKAITNMPGTTKGWLRQQQRWNQSFYREMLWTFKIVKTSPTKLHPYIIYDMIMQLLLPFLLMASVTLVVYRSITVSPIYLAGYTALLFGIAIIRALYAYIRTKEKQFFMFPMYAVLHIFLLIPLRIVSIATIKTTKWGTR